MRAQGYDGASVMSGHMSGVQTQIHQVNPNAVYVHCRPHVLNFCTVHAPKLPRVKNIMDTMQEVTLAFKSGNPEISPAGVQNEKIKNP